MDLVATPTQRYVPHQEWLPILKGQEAHLSYHKARRLIVTLRCEGSQDTQVSLTSTMTQRVPAFSHIKRALLGGSLAVVTLTHKPIK